MMCRNKIHPIFILFISILFQTALFGQSGNVGIGTPTPTDALHIQGDPAGHALRVQVGGSTKLRVLNNGGTTIGTNNVNSTPQNGLYVHGNTGIGVLNPDDKLEVNGNIELSGLLKPNGVGGQEGQFLTINGSGQMDWVDVTGIAQSEGPQFKNFRSWIFNNPNDDTWTVPDGVTRVMFELWGGGGGGASGGGGGAGGYVKAYLDVSPGQIYTIVVGEGGQGGRDEPIIVAGDGTFSSVAGPIISNLKANGGKGATQLKPGFGGTLTVSLPNAIRIRGQNGQANQFNFAQFSTGSFARTIHSGKGGSGYLIHDQGGPGAVLSLNTSDDTILYEKSAQAGTGPGSGGGGGGIDPSIFPGGNGSDGLVIVRW